MDRAQIAQFQAALIGRRCKAARRQYDWVFDLDGGVALAVSSPWRIVADGKIALASEDDGQVFGRACPVDGEEEAGAILQDVVVTAATLDRETADLTLHFGSTTRLEVFNSSMGYEGWQAIFALNDARWSVVGLGGGGVAFVAG